MWDGNRINYDDKKQGNEDTSTYGDESKIFQHTKDESYERNGGFVVLTDIFNSTLDANLALINNAEDNEWLDGQTTSLVLDFIVYNPYLDNIMYTRCVIKAEPSGRLETKVLTDALKRSYYTGFDFIRAICEVIFVIICLFYLFQKCFEMYEEYRIIQNQIAKDIK
jgi:hypothetical protein